MLVVVLVFMSEEGKSLKDTAFNCGNTVARGGFLRVSEWELILFFTGVLTLLCC